MKKIVSILLVILWMAFIFIMSSFNSMDSSSQSNIIVNFIVELFNISNIDVVSLIVRKLAHFTEYFILGVLVANMLRYFDKKVYISIVICILYAISDEVHQLFVSGRSCQILDILIDSVGSSSGIILFFIFKKSKFYIENFR